MSNNKILSKLSEFQYLKDYRDEDMFLILRVFVTSEYERDPTILERLESWLSEMEGQKGFRH